MLSLFSVLCLLAAWSPAPASPLAPEYSGKDVLSGVDTRVALTAAQKANVVVFLSAKCPCSASHEVVLKDLYRDFHARGFSFTGVHSNADEDQALAASHFKESALPFPVLQDSDQKLANAFGAFKTPHVFIVSPKGEILYQGGVDETHIAALAKKPYLKNALLAVAQGHEPDPKEVRVLGCAIKRN